MTWRSALTILAPWVISKGTSAKTGWAEVTTAPTAAVSVTAATVRTLTSTQRDFNEIPSSSSYRRAWLVVDRTGSHSTSLVLVNSSSDAPESFHLEYRSDDTSCEHTAQVPAKGCSTIAISTSLTCSASKLGTIEINAAVPFTGIAKVSFTGQNDTFIRLLTGLPDMDPVPLEAWTVYDGGYGFEFLRTSGCISFSSRMLVGVSYTVRTSVWQARADSTAEWADLPGTEKTGEICGYNPSEPGEYRGVAEITIDGVPGLYSSSDTVTIAAAVTPTGDHPSIPSFVVGEESVQFGSLSGTYISSTESIQVDWVTYEIHTSKWQRPDDATSAWADIDDTAETGEICAYDPETAGQYRASAEISRNGVKGTYVSSNVLIEEPPPTTTTGGDAGSDSGSDTASDTGTTTTTTTTTTTKTTAQPGAEQCSDLVGCFIPPPAGTFTMGSTSSDAGTDESPLTTVTISEGVQIAKYELTHARRELIMGEAASYVERDCDDEDACPIFAVAFLGITEIKIPVFLQLLNQRDTDFTYRLPTEAEWKYAARAGTTGDRHGNVDDIAWHSGNSGNAIQRVGLKEANAWGLYDMLGNVFEWVSDLYGTYPGGSVTDPTGPTTGSQRIVRGGSYLSGAADARGTEPPGCSCRPARPQHWHSSGEGPQLRCSSQGRAGDAFRQGGRWQ